MKINENKGKLIANLAFSTALVGAIFTVGATIAKEGPNVDEVTIENLLENEDVAKDTRLDELEKNEEFMFDENLTYVEAACKLEDAMDNYDDLEKVNLDKAKELKLLSKNEEKEIKNYNKRQIKDLKAAVLDDNDIYTEHEKDDAIRKLNGLKEWYRSWVSKNGHEISLEIMKEAVESAILEDLHGRDEEYYNIFFEERYASNEEPELVHIEALGNKYNLKNADSEIRDVADYIYIDFLIMIKLIKIKNLRHIVKL